MRYKPPAGFILHESLMAVALCLALVAGIAQLLAVVAGQRRHARRYTAAVHEAGNLMESLVSRPWAETTPERLESVELSEACRRCLPEARLRLDVADESDDVRRITVRIDWRGAADRRGPPVSLAAWKFRSEETSP